MRDLSSGSGGMMFYTEPVSIFDLDIFIFSSYPPIMISSKKHFERRRLTPTA